MDKFKLTEILLRYCKSLEGASGKTIITNYGRMRNLINKLDENEVEGKIQMLIDTLTIKETLTAVKKAKINIKECSCDWNRNAIAKGYKLAREIEYLWKEHPNGKEKKEKMLELALMAYDEPSLGTQLCLMSLFFKGCYKTSIEEWDELKELLKDQP